MKFARVVVAVLLIFVVQHTAAQIDHWGNANAAYRDMRYADAIEPFKKAYAQIPDNKAEQKAECIFRIAECYRLSNEPKQAIVWYDRAIKASYPNAITYYYLAEALKQSGKYEEAIDNFEKFLEKEPNNKKGVDGKRSCELALEWINDPTRYEAVNAPIINSAQSDFSPVFSDKKNDQIIFSSSREGSVGNDVHGGDGEGFPDLYYTNRDKNGKWSEPIPLIETVNTPDSEGSATLNERKNRLYFTRCGYSKEGVLGCDILVSKRQGLNWSEPEKIVIVGVADTNTVGQPAISPDDNTLVFASDMPGGFGGRDLWYITSTGRGQWSEPVNLGSAINTPGNERFPFLDFEGNLYFSSDGHMGMGGMDIFKATDAGNKQWGNVQNLKYPINSNAHDFGVIFDGDKPRGYLTSDRDGGIGGFDIWEFYLPPLVFAIEGQVRNKKTGELLADATVQLTALEDGSTYEVTTNSEGEFVLAENGPDDRYIKPNSSYKLMVSKEDFLNAVGNETTVGQEESKVFYHLYELIPKIGPIKLPQINYEFAKWDLLPESKDSLNYLYDIMIDNPNIVIELSAHTDYIGSQRDNQILSQKRAESCVKYLVEKGIAADRMKAVGYGEDKPLPGLEESKIKGLPKEENEIARAKNRRTEFSVLHSNYVPKGGS